MTAPSVNTSLYDILQVPETASREDIRLNYQRLLLQVNNTS
jgi:curved DNA-binding protein CbpA